MVRFPTVDGDVLITCSKAGSEDSHNDGNTIMRIWPFLVFVFIAVAVLSNRDGNRDSGAPKSVSSERLKQAQRTQSHTALEKMEVVFQGNWSQQEIKRLMDQAFLAYDLPATESNYNKFGSVLVRLRKEIGPTEMDILWCAHTNSFNKMGAKMLGDAMAMCSATISVLQ